MGVAETAGMRTGVDVGDGCAAGDGMGVALAVAPTDESPSPPVSQRARRALAVSRAMITPPLRGTRGGIGRGRRGPEGVRVQFQRDPLESRRPWMVR
jgi:hypothetical protein